MKRAYYQSSLDNFLLESTDSVIGIITQSHPQQLEHLQTSAWKAQVEILQSQLAQVSTPNSHLYFEFQIPRMGKRADVLLVHKGLIFIIEFKVGSSSYNSADVRQAHGYALDLKNFHEGSHNKKIIPMLVATNAAESAAIINFESDLVANPVLCNQANIGGLINAICEQHEQEEFNVTTWIESGYKPTPSIVEAAQALYLNHSVEDISRSDGGAQNIRNTSKSLLDIIHSSRLKQQKTICFVTGVP